MHLIEKYWTLRILERTYYLSPYLILNGIGLIAGLLLLDAKLDHAFGRKASRIYILYVCSIFTGWFGAHLTDALLKNQIFGHAGFTFLGGLITGCVVFIIVFMINYGSDELLTALNSGVMPLVLAHAIGRIGCYLSGCCYGKLVEHSIIPFTFFERHPTQLYESFFLLVLFIFIGLKKRMHISFTDIYLYLLLYGNFRFFIEFLRDDYRGTYYMDLSPSQWISLAMIAGGLFGVSKIFNKPPEYNQIKK